MPPVSANPLHARALPRCQQLRARNIPRPRDDWISDSARAKVKVVILILLTEHSISLVLIYDICCLFTLLGSYVRGGGRPPGQQTDGRTPPLATSWGTVPYVGDTFQGPNDNSISSGIDIVWVPDGPVGHLFKFNQGIQPPRPRIVGVYCTSSHRSRAPRYWSRYMPYQVPTVVPGAI